MSWFTDTMQSSIGKKWVMALTGLFLITFLIVHLIGNLQLLKTEGDAFNIYAAFMTTNPLIKTTSYLLYASILIHAIYGLWLTQLNRKARPIRYAVTNPGANSTWSSRNMGILGTIILLFIVIHMRSFWYKMHFGEIGKVMIDGQEYKDLYTVTKTAFASEGYVLFYVIAMAAIAFHLVHGFQSAFQTMGWNHPKYSPVVKAAGLGIAIIIPALFAFIPVYMLLNK